MAKAAAIDNQISVIHVCSDEKLNDNFEILDSESDGIYTIMVYYRKVKSNLPLYSQWLKFKRLQQAYDMAFVHLQNQKGKVDLIQLNVAMPAGIGVLHLSKKYNVPFVLNENWSGYTKEDGNYKGPLLKYFTQKIVAQAKKMMPTSLYLQEAMLAHGLKGDYEVVPNVVDLNRFLPKDFSPKDKIRLVHISSLTEREKNVSGILRAFQLALKQVPNMELVIIGEGDNKLELKALAEFLNISEHTKFKGRVVGDELIQTLQSSHALVMFSHYETFCLVIIEALACGKPVITSDAGAIPGYMNDRLGMMVQKNNEEQLREAIVKFALKPNAFDHLYLRSFAEKFSYQHVGQQLSKIYQEAILKQ